jgi:hypothetical protein
MIVTPGYTFTSTESVTHTKLNAAAVPTVTLEAEDITPEIFDAAASNAGSVVRPNFLRNGNFSSQLWQRGTSQVSCPVNTITYRADWWGVKPELVTSAGLPTPATVKYEQGGTGPTNSPLSLDTLKLTGDSTGAAITNVDVFQDIPARTSYALRTTVTLSVWVYNGSGAAFTPTLYIDTADAEDNFSAVTNRTSAAGTSCTNAAWTKQTITLDLTSVTNMANGVRLRLRLPSPALSSNAKTVQLAQAKLERGSTATAFTPERDETAEPGLSGDDLGGVPTNYFDNPTLSDETWLATSVTLTENLALGGGPRGWLARPAGASGAVLDRYVDSGVVTARITGATTVSTVDFIQDIPRSVAMALAGRTMTVSLMLYNGTGGAFTPTLMIDSCDSENAFEDVTNRKTQSLSECPSTAWTQLSHTFDPDDLTDYDNGFRLYIRIPTGSLDSNGKSVLFAELQFTDGATVPSWTPSREPAEAVIQGQTRGLVIVGDGTDFDVTVTEAILKNASGRAIVAQITSTVTIDPTSTGAAGLDTGSPSSNTWYYLWLISNGITHSAMLSLSGTAPTMPAGYSYRARVGAARYKTSSWLVMRQDDDVVAIGQSILDGAAGVTSLTTLDCAAGLPPIAREVWGIFGLTTAAACKMLLANNDSSSLAIFTCPSTTTWAPLGITAAGPSAPFRLATSFGSSNLKWISDNTTANKLVSISGYRL